MRERVRIVINWEFNKNEIGRFVLMAPTFFLHLRSTVEGPKKKKKEIWMRFIAVR